MKAFNKILMIFMLIAGSILLISAGGQEETVEIGTDTEEKPVTPVLASNITSFTLTDEEDNTIGTVSRVIIDLQAGYTTYLVFAIEDFFEQGAKLVPIPVQYLLYNAGDNSYTITLSDKEVFKNAPSFDDITQANISELTGIGSSVSTYWQNAGIIPPQKAIDQAREQSRLSTYGYGPGLRVFPGSMLLFSELKDYSIPTTDDKRRGHINDLAFSPDTGRILAVFYGDDRVPVPMSAFTYNIQEDSITLDVTDTLVSSAPRIQADTVEQAVTSPDFPRNMRTYWLEEQLSIGFRSGMRIIPGTRAKITTLIGYDLTSWEGASLGTVTDFIIDRNGKVLYAIIEREKWYPIPVQALTVDLQAANMMLDMRPEEFEEFPVFEENQLPETELEQWDREITEYWKHRLISPEGRPYLEQGPVPEPVGQEGKPQAVLASTVLGFTVKNPVGETMGMVEELYLNLDQSTLEYWQLDIGDRLIPVPFEQLQINIPFNGAILDISEETLRRAPGIEEHTWTEIREYWSGITTDDSESED
jgi:sporulation protein YlmC with PRC-barrel domain